MLSKEKSEGYIYLGKDENAAQTNQLLGLDFLYFKSIREPIHFKIMIYLRDTLFDEWFLEDFIRYQNIYKHHLSFCFENKELRNEIAVRLL